MAQLRSRKLGIEQEQRSDNITFRVAGQSRAQVFPLDLIPRMVDAHEWTQLCEGLAQRARALDAFLRDVYAEQAIVADGIIGVQALDCAPGFRSTGAWRATRSELTSAGRTSSATAPVAGWCSKTICECRGRRHTPSSIAGCSASMFPSCPRSSPSRTLAGRLTCCSKRYVQRHLRVRPTSSGWPCSPPAGKTRPGLNIRFWRRRWRLHWCSRRTCQCATESCCSTSVPTSDPSTSSYARMDEDMLLSSTGYDGAPLRPGLLGAITTGNLTIANALANGVADDKAIYAYVPAMIEYYLGEKPKLAQVPTWLCAEREQRDFVLANLGDLVVKPIDGLGGSGVLIRAGSLRSRTGRAPPRAGNSAGAVHRPGGGQPVHPSRPLTVTAYTLIT